jgi:uncharacterized membrane protein
MTAETATYGPADLYVVEFPTDAVPTAVTASLMEVATAGVITVLDIALVRTDADGSSQLIELADFGDELGLSAIAPPAAGLIGTDDIDDLAEDLTPGTSCLIVLLENTWARRITQAVQDAAARVVTVERFPADVVNAVAELAADGEED